MTQQKPNLPSEEALRKLLAIPGMQDNVQALLDQHKELKFRIEQKPDGTYELADSLTGAALWLKRFITEDEETLMMKRDAGRIASLSDEVLITGETGTGKELVARAMLGDREGKFVRINCAAMPENLLESELFGHVKGAFTGADSNKRGLVFDAVNGVMLMDEIGDMPLLLQSKILNVLQSIDGKRFARPVGSNEDKEINCRFVFATHRDLIEMVSKDLFRKDLYARISTFELHIKSLKTRKEDIPGIVKEIGRLLGIDQKADEFIKVYRDKWTNDEMDLSFNVRSLERALKRYNVLGRI